MSDTSKYVNAYIDVVVGQIHEDINVILQNKAQLKVANDTIAEKDAVIGRLSQQLESNKIENDEFATMKTKAKQWEDAHNAMAGKAAHLDTALSQLAEMKKEVQTRNDTIRSLQAIIDDLKHKIHELENPVPVVKKQINKKKTSSAITQDVIVESEPIATQKPDDDF